MQAVAVFRYIVRPVVWTCNAAVTLMIKVDTWYKVKKPATRRNISKDFRWLLVCLIFIWLWQNEKYTSGNSIDADNRRTASLLGRYKAELRECQQWKIDRLEKEIEELKAYKRNDIEHKKKIETIKRKL